MSLGVVSQIDTRCANLQSQAASRNLYFSKLINLPVDWYASLVWKFISKIKTSSPKTGCASCHGLGSKMQHYMKQPHMFPSSSLLGEYKLSIKWYKPKSILSLGRTEAQTTKTQILLYRTVLKKKVDTIEVRVGREQQFNYQPVKIYTKVE